MTKKRKQFRRIGLSSIFEVSPVYYYFGLGLLCILLIAFSWRGKKEAKPSETENEVVATLKKQGYSRTPDPVAERPDLYTTLRQAGGEELIIVGALNERIGKLENVIATHVAEQAEPRPDWISTAFVATGIDRDTFQPRLRDDQISVERWQNSETAPVMDGQEAFQEFIANSMMPWLGSMNFRMEFQVYATDIEQNIVEAKLVSESYGQSGDELGIQATSIWKTKWSWVNESLTLDSIEIQAQEQINAKIPGGKLMLDCTESILQHCESLPNQLAFGLDYWARRIPNIDIVGNHGLAVADINLDGLDDIYVCQPHGLPNLLLVQNLDGTVDDISKSSRLDILDESHAALMIDLDNDRDQDLVVSTDESLLLLSNTGQGQFQLEHQLSIGRNAFSISAADYDQDGDLDLFLCKFQAVNRQNDLFMFPGKMETADDGGRNVLLRNEEGWNFKDVTEQVGISNDNNFYSRAAVWADYDLDGDSDLYVTNEFAADQIFENQAGWFSDVSEELGINVRARHRSVSVGEFNQDGRLDFFVATDVPHSATRVLQKFNISKSDVATDNATTEMLLSESQFWLSTGKGKPFSSFFLRAPIFSSQSAFGSATADLNNDGLEDIVVTNGYLTRGSIGDVDELLYANSFSNSSQNSLQTVEAESIRIARIAHDASELCRIGHSFASHQRNRCYLNIGEKGFANFSSLAGVDFPDDGRAVATTDWDGDGDADIVMACRSGPQLRIICNQLNSRNSYVHFDLVGTDSNFDAIGARVELYLDGRSTPLVKIVQAGSGNLSQSTKRMMFGLGDTDSIKKAVVFWPTGQSQTFANIDINNRYRIIEGEERLQRNNNERTELAIQPNKSDGTSSLPLASRRAWFYPRQPLPRLQFQSARGKWSRLEPFQGKPLIALFCSRNVASQKILESHWQQFSKDKVDCVAVFLEPDADDSEQWSAEKKMIETCKFPFRWGTASASTRDKLQFMFGEWFSHQQLEKIPFALLIDGTGSVCGFYPDSALDLKKISTDVELIDEPDWKYRVESAPLGGRWMASYRLAKLNRIRTRLKEVGYGSDAELLAEKSQPQRAMEFCHKGIELDSIGDTDRARLFFQQAIMMDTNCIPAYVAKGNLLRRMAFQRQAQDADIRIQIQKAAAEDFERALRLDPLNTEAIIGRANVAIDQNRIDEAVHQLSAHIQLDPTRYEIHAIIGRLLFHQKKHKQAAEYLVTAFEHRPTLPNVAGDLGLLYLSAGNYEQAQKFLRLANRLQPSDKNILRLLAETEFVLGQFVEAVSLFERVIELDPNRRRSKNLLAWLLVTCPHENCRDAEQALAILNPLVELFGDRSSSTLEIYAACLAEKGQFDQALEYQNRAAKLISDGKSTDKYSAEQIKGLVSRLELYKQKQPYRTADISQIPISPDGILN